MDEQTFDGALQGAGAISEVDALDQEELPGTTCHIYKKRLTGACRLDALLHAFELDINEMGYLLHSGRPYILWSAPSVLAKHFTINLYGAGPTATACSARRRKSFPRLREFRRLKRKVNSSR